MPRPFLSGRPIHGVLNNDTLISISLYCLSLDKDFEIKSTYYCISCILVDPYRTNCYHSEGVSVYFVKLSTVT